MNRISLLYLAPVLFLLLSLSACSGLVIDRLPKNVDKGYVEFFLADRRYLYRGVTEIRQIDQKDNEKKVGAMGNNTGRDRLIVSARPGQQTYVVKRGDDEQLITLRVEKGMVLPVKVAIKESSRQHLKKDKKGKLIATTVRYADINLEPGESYSETKITARSYKY